MNKEIRKFLNDHLGVVEIEYDPIKKGGSDRSFYRVRLPGGKTFIFMEYGNDVEENAYWVGINRFMTNINIPVPLIVAFDYRRHFLLLEDLGGTDLYSQTIIPWHKRRQYYLRALSEIHRLHRIPIAEVPADLKLAKGYDRSLYRWEHNYFMENFVEAVCHLNVDGSLMRDWMEESDELINHLQKITPCLIHRDFQSQNIMIKNDRPVFIDFQGMRQGNLFYDLGSLICDPYVTFSPDERNELIAFYYRIMQPNYSLDEFSDHFWEGAAQRLMQALGAYGFLGLKKNKPDFLKHIPRGIKNLVTAATNAGTLPVLKELAGNCMNKIQSKPA
ncbi:MAG: aminoglycoside phosphotransferase family protein [Smithellaceae bacterium]